MGFSKNPWPYSGFIKVLQLILLLLGGCIFSIQVYATHGMGGEITWRCQPNGAYVFTMKFYRDCNGIPGPTNPPPTLTTNVPGVTSIPLMFISLTDISPVGSNTSGISPCPVCPPNQQSGGGLGAVHEYLYRSNPVMLPGTPPPTGWVFSWGECCRSNAITNMVNPGALSMGLRAVMYPYPGMIPGQCRDNSPFFAEKPNVIICTGYQFTYNHFAVDNEMDSLVYAWDAPVSSPPIAPQPYAPGYSITSPLPGPMQNPSNIPAALNPLTGAISFTSFTSGYFVTVVKASAYKCGVLAAEIFREINVVLIGGCIIPVNPVVPNNNPPIVTIINRKTNLPLSSNSFDVCVGDTVKLRIVAHDADPHPVEGVQSVTFTISSAQLNSPPNVMTNQCLIPPCAYTSAPLPLTAFYGTQMDLDWVITCDHLGFDTLCTRISNTFIFVIKIMDNYCRAPAQNTNTLAITVKRCSEVPAPEQRCASVENPSGDARLYWNPPRDTFGLFHKYEIYGSLDPNGPYLVLDSIYNPVHNVNTNEILIPAAKLVGNFGYHVQDTSLHFRIKTYSGCQWDSISSFSNTIRTMKLHVDTGMINAAVLTWNSVHVPLLPTSNQWYYIHREYPAGNWSLIDSLQHPPGIQYDTILTYVDTFPRQLCNDIVVYRVHTTDALYCESWSSFDTLIVDNNAPLATITPPASVICNGSSVTLSASAGGSLYQWSNGANTQSINVSLAGTYTVTITYNPGGCTATATATVQQVIPCVPILSVVPASICSGSPANLVINCMGGAGPPPTGYSYSYINVTTGQTFGPFTSANLPIQIPVSPATTTTYQLTSFSADYPAFNLSCASAPLPPNVTLTVHPLPAASISGTTTICEGQTASIQLNFTGSGPWTYSYNSPSGPVGPLVTPVTPVTITVAPTSTFNYTLIGVNDAFCQGTVSGNALITVNALPQATLSGTTSICENQSATLTITFANAPGPYTITYNPGNITVSNVNNPYTFTVNPTTTTNYTLVSVSNANCTGTVAGNALITVHPLPEATISGNPTICNGDQTSIQISFTGSPPFTYTYTDGTNIFGPFVTAVSPVFVTVSPSSTSLYSLVSVSDANCTGNVNGNALVTVHPLPTAHITGSDTICFGEQTQLLFIFSGTGPFTYSFTDGTNVFGPFVSNLFNAIQVVSPSSTTTYSIVSIQDVNCNGTISGSATITVFPLPTATLTGTTTICNGQTAMLTIDFTGVAPFEYSYSDGTNTYGPFITASNQVTIPVNPTVTTTYTLTPVVFGAGCSGNTAGSATITVHQLPDATISGNSTICNGDATSFQITFNGTAPFTYSYTDGTNTYGPFTTVQGTITIPVSPTTTTTYTLISISDNNCTGTTSGSATVTVHPLPEAQLSGTASICMGDTSLLIINFNGTPPFTYSYSDGFNIYGPFTTNNNPEIITLQPTQTVSYSLISVTDANCSGNVLGTATITVNELPTAVISQNSAICVGQSTTFQVVFTGTAPFAFTYTDGIQIFGPVITFNNPAWVQVTPQSSVTYTLVSITDANCPGTVAGSAQVTVFPLPTPVITGITDICQGEETTFDAGPGYVAYLWNTGQITQTITVNMAGTYTVTVTDINGCQNSDDQTLTVHAVPILSFTYKPEPCADSIIHFNNSSIFPAGSAIQWIFGNVGTSTLVHPTQIFTQPGTYPVTLIIVTPFGCSDTLTQDVEVIFYPAPVAEFIAEPKEAGIFNSLINFTDLSQNAVSWWWNFGDGHTSTVRNPSHLYDDMGLFQVTLVVQNVSGCEDAYRESVYITPFFVPNAFTPNNDGLNENFFEAGYTINVAAYTMRIFNRWGQKVYENDSYYKPWNGIDASGKPAPEGVYVYTIKVTTLTGKDYHFTGRVTLLR